MKYLQFPFINSPFPDHSAMDRGTPPHTVRHSRPPAIPPLTPSQFLIPSGVYALGDWLACHLQRHNMIIIYQSVSALPAPSSVHCPSTVFCHSVILISTLIIIIIIIIIICCTVQTFQTLLMMPGRQPYAGLDGRLHVCSNCLGELGSTKRYNSPAPFKPWRRLADISRESRETSNLFQRCSKCWLVQRFNAVLLHDSSPGRDRLLDIHNFFQIFQRFKPPWGSWLPRVKIIIITSTATDLYI